MANPKQENHVELIYERMKLFEAIKKRDKETIKKLININNVNINIPDARGNPSLYWTLIKPRDLDIMIILLDSGADIHAKNQLNLQPLDVAIQNNNREATSLLIEKGALVGENLNTFLLKAIKRNNHRIVKILIDNGMQYNPSIDLKVALNAAITQRQLKIIEYILPHCQFSKSSDKYIPRELIIKHKLQNDECVELLLKWNFTVDPTSNHDRDFIYAAVEKGYSSIVLQLLKLGIDVNLLNLNTRLSLLKLACLKKHYEIVKNLLMHNARINMSIPIDARILDKYYYNDVDKNNHSPSSIYNEEDLWNLTYLYIAVIHSDLTRIKLLLNKSTLRIDDPQFLNLTGIAVQNNCKDIVRIFLDQGVDVNGINNQGQTLLHFCVNADDNKQDSRYSIAKLLLKKGATNHLQTPENSLIFEAIKNEHHKIAQLFLDYNANIQYTCSYTGDTPLHKALEKNFDKKFIENLLKLNPSVNSVNYKLVTPLLTACKTPLPDQLEIIKILLQHNANVNCSIDIVDINSIFPYARDRDIKEFMYLFEKNLNFDYGTNMRGRTPLHLICEYNTDETVNIIKLLLQYKANIEAVDAGGCTPLFVACYSNNIKAVKCLLDNNANVNHIDKQNLTALYITTKYNRYSFEIVKILLEHKASVRCIDEQGKSIIHVIAENNNAEIIETLFHTRIDFNGVDKDGNTPLQIAVKNKCIDVIKNLLKYGADINILDKRNRTPLRNAIKYMSIVRKKFEDYRFRRDLFRSSRYFENNCENVRRNIWSPICDINTYQKIIKLMKRHVVKLKVAGLMVNYQNVKIVHHPDDSDYEYAEQDKIDCAINISQLEDNCKLEIEKMRTESISVNNMTLYDLLRKNIHFLTRFVKNKKIQQTLELKVYDEKFPLYIDIVRSRFRDAKLQYRLVNSAKKYFHLNICPILSDNCMDTIFSYLNNQEIKIFIGVLKPLK